MSDSAYGNSSSLESSYDGSSGGSSPEKPVKRHLRIRYYESSEDRRPAYAYALKAEVVSSYGVPAHVFVYQRSTDGTSGDSVDTFIQIASPVECEEVPEDAPRPDEGMPYYRTDSVTLWFRCPEDRRLAKEKIDEDVKVLVSTFNELEGNLEVQEEKTYE